MTAMEKGERLFGISLADRRATNRTMEQKEIEKLN